jgi:hypothetical protein
MHYTFTQHLAESRIQEFHREAAQARLAKAAIEKSGNKESPRVGLRVRAYRRALATVALSIVMLIGVSTAALAYPTDAGVQNDTVKRGPAGIELCMRKQSPDGALCRDAATGSFGPVAPAEAVESPVVEAQSSDLDAGVVLVLMIALVMLGAGAASVSIRRHATV